MNKLCKEPLFDFHLDRIEDCQITNESNKITTCWFYLTCGYYRIVAGNNLLLNYSDSLLDKRKRELHNPDTNFFRVLQKNYPSYVDYYVARLWEDLIEMLYITREPLPKQLEAIMNNPTIWGDKADEWLNKQSDNDDEAWDVYYQGTRWLGNRSLNNSYLNPSSKIYIYLSIDDMINFVWDNKDVKISGLLAWSSERGRFSLTKKEFLEEIQLFNDRFINQMGDRVKWVRNNWNDSAKYNNFKSLKQEHEIRSSYLSEKLTKPINNENFDAVFQAIEKMSIGYGLPNN